jgi:hypothetical protein
MSVADASMYQNLNAPLSQAKRNAEKRDVSS